MEDALLKANLFFKRTAFHPKKEASLKPIQSILATILLSAAAYAFTSLSHPSNYYAAGMLVVVGVFIVIGDDTTGGLPVAGLAGLRWNLDHFCQNFLITGAIGSGKTVALYNLLYELNRRVKNWGGLWLDNKGNSHQDLAAIQRVFGRETDVVFLQVRNREQPANWKPPHRYNPMADPGFSFEELSYLLANNGTPNRASKNTDFFAKQAATHLLRGMEALREVKKPVTFTQLYYYLTSTIESGHLIKALEAAGTDRGHELARHFATRFVAQTGDQLSGVLGTIDNILAPFVVEAVAEVMCSHEPNTVDIEDIDQGKILCPFLPQAYPASLYAINTLLKQLFYFHVMRRYERRGVVSSSGAPRTENMLVCFMDEAQHSVRSGEYGDHRFLDRLRDAKAGFVAATQDHQSFYGPLGKQDADILMLQFRNRIIYTAASQLSAEISADFIGKTERMKITRGVTAGRTSISRTPTDEHIIKAHQIRQLRPHFAYILHCAGSLRHRVKLRRIDPSQGVLPSV